MANNQIIQDIKRNIAIESVLQERGYHLERHGGQGKWKLKEHDSFIIDTTAQKFWWNSAGAQGSVIDMVMALDGCSQSAAISELAKKIGNPTRAPTPPPVTPQARSAPAPLVLPAAAKDKWPRIYAYLSKTRGIDKAVIEWLHKNKLIYPDERGNLVYVSYNHDGNPEYAAARGTNTQKKYCHVIGGNYEARCGFNLYRPDCTRLFVCEAAIDAFSIMSLLLKNGKDFTQYAYLSLESCYEGPLPYHLKRLPQINTIYLAQDADAAGDTSREKCHTALKQMDWAGKTVDFIPRHGKDWNDTLQHELSQGVTIMLDEQAVHVEIAAGRDLGKAMLSILQQILNALQHPQLHHGKQTARQLNLQGRELKEVEIADNSVKEIKRQMRAYGVDFSIFKDERTKKLHLCFKAQDHARVATAVGHCVEGLTEDKEKPPAASVDAVCEEAVTRAQQLNAQQTVPLAEHEAPQL